MAQDREPRKMTYRELLTLPPEAQVPAGTIVTDIDPYGLKTTQDWFTVKKARRALDMYQDGKFTEPVEFRIVHTPKGRSLVLGDGNHRAGMALYGGIAVDGKVSDKEVTPNQKIFELKRVAAPYADILAVINPGDVIEAMPRGRSRVIKATRTRPVTPEQRATPAPDLRPPAFPVTSFAAWERSIGYTSEPAKRKPDPDLSPISYAARDFGTWNRLVAAGANQTRGGKD